MPDDNHHHRFAFDEMTFSFPETSPEFEKL